MTDKSPPPHKTIRTSWAYWTAIWKQGWKLMAKTLLGAIVLSGAFLPLRFLSPLLDRLPGRHGETLSAVLHLVLAVFILAIYAPLAFYVAGSWVGFCKRIDPDEQDE